jgi:hypothetical protein
VLELTLLEATIVACYATATVLDAWRPAEGAVVVVRVARDELWIMGPRSERCALLRAAESSLHTLAPGALVIDQTDGWTGWSLAGTGAAHAMARLTVMRLDRQAGDLHQGAVAGVPAKVILTESDFRIFVPSPVGHHLRDRVLEACGDLQPITSLARAFAGPGR